IVLRICAATTASVEAACRSLTVDKRRDLALPTDGPPNRTTVTAKIRKQAVMIRVGKVMVGSSDWVEIGRGRPRIAATAFRSEEHTSELQSLMRISYAVS